MPNRSSIQTADEVICTSEYSSIEPLTHVPMERLANTYKSLAWMYLYVFDAVYLVYSAS